ncbi:urease subunit beta [Azospira inquinata]|uniref:Urease subunit beta n=1 Tax=Azospira inquinata TaxID=2785627 RepID=A0A975XTL8_9RHOO|nr:urease subunit beta [Azospira inquinata]QWT46796.1 urease subunit beta [Azospira inquinata]QWT47881.1 urease subunit beta [Azospira inquinata]
MKPGEVICGNTPRILNQGQETRCLSVENRGSRPIQVGSHFHFFEANRFLAFDRQAAFGFRPDLPSGAAIRFEPGERKEVHLVRIGGKGAVFGLNRLTDGQTHPDSLPRALDKARSAGFLEEQSA